MSQPQRYQTIYTQPNKYTTSKCHNHNVIKQFICSQTNTRPANVTITMLSNSLYAAKKHASGKCHYHNIMKQFICSQTNTRLVNVTITILSNSLYAAKHLLHLVYSFRKKGFFFYFILYDSLFMLKKRL